jgi:hypothetical protein
MNRTFWKREIAEGMGVPRGWHCAWREPKRGVMVCMRAPFHRIAGVWRAFAWRMHVANLAASQEEQERWEMGIRGRERQRLAEEYASGYMSGWRECYEACKAAFAAEPECARHYRH